MEDDTLLYGNLQAEDYFIAHKEEIKKWLAVRPEYDCKEYRFAGAFSAEKILAHGHEADAQDQPGDGVYDHHQ